MLKLMSHNADSMSHNADSMSHNADSMPHNADSMSHNADSMPHNADSMLHVSTCLKKTRLNVGLRLDIANFPKILLLSTKCKS